MASRGPVSLTDATYGLQPAFFQRVLDVTPTPLMVVDASGVVLYGNALMRQLTGWSMEEGVGRSIFDSVHQDDVTGILDAFGDLVGDDPDPEWADRPWAPINFRMIDRWGSSIPVEVTGRTMLEDPEVGGIVYEVRPAREREIFQGILGGFASEAKLSDQLAMIVELVDATTIDIDSAVLRRGRGEQFRVVAASTDALLEAVSDGALVGDLATFGGHTDSPRFVPVEAVDGDFGAALGRIGYADAWCIDTVDEVGGSDDDGCRILAFTEKHHVPTVGVVDRLTRGAELASFLVVRERARVRLEQAAHHDPLTGLPNRLGLERHFRDERRAGFDELGVSVLFVDLDGFKAVNDRHGHAMGDRVLRAVAERIDAATRPSDLVARFGGDEFAVVIPHGIGDDTIVADVGSRIVDAIARPILLGGVASRLTASIGRFDASSTTDLGAAIAAADRAMYEAKRSGGGRIHLATSLD